MLKPFIFMRKLLLVVFFINCILIAKGQNLTVEGTAPDLYITHTVSPKENFYSIGRLYNQAPKSIAALNKITMEKGLTIGQKIKIPLNAQNYDTGDSKTGDNSIPLTHIVTKSETLFKIAQDNNLTAEQIRKWNHLSSDHIAPGTPLVIGHLKANNAAVKNNAAPEANTNVPSSAETAGAKPAANEAEKDPSVSAGQTLGQAKNEKPVKEKSPEENSPAANVAEKASEDATAPVTKKDTALAVIPEETKQPSNTAGTPIKEEAAKPQETSSTETAESKKSASSTSETGSSTEGTFASLFNQNASQKSLNTKSGEAATFKSTSGWQDKKYYVLISNVTPGTILKIASSDNKIVYAKVLGSMPEMKENDGLLLRISNAAASYLGIIDPKFPVQISYYQ